MYWFRFHVSGRVLLENGFTIFVFDYEKSIFQLESKNINQFRIILLLQNK